jgi:hypothetical protein
MLAAFLISIYVSDAQTNSPILHRADYVEYRLDTRTNGLSHAWLVLRTEPQSKEWTVYTDVDGDSVFDAMVHVTAKDMKSYILVSNSWVQVNNTKSGFRVANQRWSKSGQRYVFRGHSWELQTAK